MDTIPNRRGSLRIEAYLPLWFRKINLDEVVKVKSQISDYAVQRHAVHHDEETGTPEDRDLKVLFEKINLLQKTIHQYIQQIHHLKKHPYENHQITLSAGGCSLTDMKGKKGLKEGDWVELHLLLPTHPLDIFILGRVDQPGHVIVFDILPSDQEDWIIEYLIHRQQEDLRLKSSDKSL